jgi:hypothetical protein
MAAQHTSLTMTLCVSLPSLQPFFAHMPILNSNHAYENIHICMTSTDPGHHGRVSAQGHPMGLRPCRFRAGYNELLLPLSSGSFLGRSWAFDGRGAHARDERQSALTRAANHTPPSPRL